MNWRNIAKAVENAPDEATRDATWKHINTLTDEYAREVFGLPEEEIARINAEVDADIDAQIKAEIGVGSAPTSRCRSG